MTNPDSPALTDLIGLDPNFTGGLSTEEYLRRQRCGECDEALTERDDIKRELDAQTKAAFANQAEANRLREELAAAREQAKQAQAVVTRTLAELTNPMWYGLLDEDVAKMVDEIIALLKGDDTSTAAPKATFLPAINSAGVGEGNCNCQAIKGTPNYPGPWHPHGDTPNCPPRPEESR